MVGGGGKGGGGWGGGGRLHARNSQEFTCTVPDDRHVQVDLHPCVPEPIKQNTNFGKQKTIA